MSSISTRSSRGTRASRTALSSARDTRGAASAVHAGQCRREVTSIRALLGRIPGLTLVDLAEQPRCCGAAGSYFVEHPDIAGRLRAEKSRRSKQRNPICCLTNEHRLPHPSRQRIARSRHRTAGAAPARVCWRNSWTMKAMTQRERVQHRQYGGAIAQSVAEMDAATDVRRQQQIGLRCFDLRELFGAQPTGNIGMLDKNSCRPRRSSALFGKIDQRQPWNAAEQRADRRDLADDIDLRARQMQRRACRERTKAQFAMRASRARTRGYRRHSSLRRDRADRRSSRLR